MSPEGGAGMPTLKLTSRGQVTLRKEVLRHFGVEPGDKIDLELLPGGKGAIHATRKKGKIEDFFGCLAGKTDVKLTIEEINEAIADAAAAEVMESFNR
jgi:bifunctional DNA-binding transcriptional regulator/antitoxin component of YhaV-PrlF toxin-antitoxin module